MYSIKFVVYLVTSQMSNLCLQDISIMCRSPFNHWYFCVCLRLSLRQESNQLGHAYPDFTDWCLHKLSSLSLLQQNRHRHSCRQRRSRFFRSYQKNNSVHSFLLLHKNINFILLHRNCFVVSDSKPRTLHEWTTYLRVRWNRVC